MANIFITGGAGFIGSHTVDLCVEQGHEVTVYDIRPWGEAVNLHPQKEKIRYIEGDILQYDKLKDAMRGHTHVLHLAALVSVPESIQDPVRFHDTNVTGTLHVFEAAREVGIYKLVYASSAAVYGSETEVPLKEDATLAPLSPYGLHKVMNEEYAELYNNSFGQTFLGLRYFNVFGPRQDPHSPYSGVISIFTEKIRNGEPISIYGDGKATRDFVSVFDVARANLLALLSDASGVCNIGSGEGQTIQEVVTKLERVLDTKARCVFEPERIGDIKHSVSSIAKAQEQIAYQPTLTFTHGLEKMST